jgi:membrane dipeptidase
VGSACAGPTREGADRRRRDLLARAADVTGPALVVDLHAHPGAFTRRVTGELPLRALGEMAAGGVDAAFFCAVGDGPVIGRDADGRLRQHREPAPGELWASTRGQLGRVVDRARQGHLDLVRAPADLRRARQTRRPAALLALEGADPLEGDPGRVEALHALGVRSIQLVHYRINELGDIQTEPPRHGGLTGRGASVIAAMNRLGMIVDGAHADRETLLGILDASRSPIVVSHTGPGALRDVRRHLPDDLLRAVAARGGVIGVWPMARPGETVEQFLAEIDHVRRVAGPDHVGIGTDMAGLATFTSIPTYREMAPVPAALLARGFVEGEVRQILGGNLVRVFEEAAARAAAAGGRAAWWRWPAPPVV